MENMYQEITFPSTVSSSPTYCYYFSKQATGNFCTKVKKGQNCYFCNDLLQIPWIWKHRKVFHYKSSIGNDTTSKSTDSCSSPMKHGVSIDLYPKQSNLCEQRCLYKCTSKKTLRETLPKTSNILSGESETQSMMSDVQQAIYSFAFIIQMFTRPKKNA